LAKPKRKREILGELGRRKVTGRGIKKIKNENVGAIRFGVYVENESGGGHGTADPK